MAAQPITTPCAKSSLESLERVSYFPRQLLTADDMRAEQDYFRQKLRRHNRFLHGWGVVCGLDVTAAPTAKAPWRVAIDEGYALGPYGDEIFVGERVYLDLADCSHGATTHPCEPDQLVGSASLTAVVGTAREHVFLAIRYSECSARPVRVTGAGCGCDDGTCEHSRVRDSFELRCHDKPPTPPTLDSICRALGERQPIPCPPCPDDPWVLLARVVIPTSPKIEIVQAQIDAHVRPRLFSTASIQKQVIECCCGKRPQPAEPKPVQVSVTPEGRQSAPVTQVVLKFDKDVVASTVTRKTVRVLEGTTPIPGSVVYHAGNREATFTPSAKVLRAGSYSVVAVGTGAAPIRDVDNLALDGNKDGTPGADSTTSFWWDSIR